MSVPPKTSEVRRRGAASTSALRPGVSIPAIFLPFGTGYFLSYLFRTMTGSIADRLLETFDLGPRGLGLLTSVYFLTFATFQIPAGLLIDRYGPRRVQAALLLVAACGTCICALAPNAVTLLLGRALVGLGCSGALVTGVKAIALWLPEQHRALGNCCLVMCGGLGSMASTVPLEMLAEGSNWRIVFAALAAGVLLVAAVVWLLVPDTPEASSPDAAELKRGLQQVLQDRRFWRVAPLSASIVGTAFAVHGLWAARWLADVAHMAPAAIATVLLAMGATLTLGAATLGLLATYLRRIGITTTALLAATSGAFIAIEVAIVLDVPLQPIVLWSTFAVFGSVTVVSFTIVGELFPPDMVGRANSVLNVLHLGTAFAMQAGIGAIAALWPQVKPGSVPAAAYAAAFSALIAIQAAALTWFGRGAQVAAFRWPAQRPVRPRSRL